MRTWTFFPIAAICLSQALAAPGMDAVIDGSPVTIAAAVEKPEILLGEPAYVRLTFENRSDQDLYFTYFSGMPRDSMFKIVARNPDPVDTSQPFGGIRGGNGMTMQMPVRAKSKQTLDFFLPDFVPFKHAGDQPLTISAKLQFSRSGDIRKIGTTFPLDLALDVPLKVLPNDERKMDDLIKEWDHTLADAVPHDLGWERGKALVKLCQVEDPRAVAPLARFAVKPFYDSQAIGALAKFPTDAAIDALQKASLCQGADLERTPEGPTPATRTPAAEAVRYSAALALAKNTHSRARDVLNAMHDDPYEPVRNVIPKSTATAPAATQSK